MAGSLRVETFPAPPILNLTIKPREEHKEQESGQEKVQAQAQVKPTNLITSSPSSAAVDEDDELPVQPFRKMGLSLRLSRAEAVEDEEEASIQVEGQESEATPFTGLGGGGGMKLKLSLAGVDVEDGATPIQTSQLDAGAALESRWQLKVKEADVAIKRASFEVTNEGILKTKSFAIGKTGFHRTTEHNANTPSSSTLITLSPSSSSSTPSSSLPMFAPPSDRPHLEVSEASLIEMGLLGRGAGGKVLKSIHKPSMTIIALKCIDVSDKVKRSQLLKELKELDTAYCPHIVAFYGAYYQDLTCTVKLGLEYMNRGSLQAIVHEHGKLHELALTAVVKQTLLGLLHLHSHRKLHRDIKPGNILANHFGQAKLSDFGILAELNNSMAKCGTFVGTTIYMSPERLTSEAYSYPADVWSLGMTIITMATGSFPLSTEDGYWGLVMHFNTQPPPQLPDTFSPLFRDFISRCMVKEPAKRWAVKELLDHPWIVLGCEAEEGLTYWPEGARMYEPDPAVVKKQKEERLERARKWEEAEEKKKQRKGLRTRPSASPSVVKAEAEAAAKEVGKSSTIDQHSPGSGGGSDGDEDSAKVRHRRKAAITRFHPVGLLHLQAEAHVQNEKKTERGKKGQKEEKAGDSLYADSSDEEDEESGAGEKSGSGGSSRHGSVDEPATSKPGLTSRSKRALGVAPSIQSSLPSNGSAVPSTLPSAARPRQSSNPKVSGVETNSSTGEGIDRSTSLHSLASPKRPSPLPMATTASSTSSPSVDFNLVSPNRAARHNVKFVNGQLMSSPLHPSVSFTSSPSTSSSSSPPLILSVPSLSKQVSAPAEMTNDYRADATAFAFPSLQLVNPSPDGSPIMSASSPSLLPSLAHPNQSPSTSSFPASSPPSSSPLIARAKPLSPLVLDSSSSRDRAQSTGSVDSPTLTATSHPSGSPLSFPHVSPTLPALQPLSPGFPALHRGSPALHRRSPSVPAFSPMSPSSSSAHSPLNAVSTSSPHAPAVEGQRRGLRGRRPSITVNGAPVESTLTPTTTRAIIKLPALQTTVEGTAETSSTAAIIISSGGGDGSEKQSPVLEERKEKGLRRKLSSISSSITDLPPVTPLHFRSVSSIPIPSPLLSAPLSPRSSRMLSMISPSELDDTQVVLQALLDRYREREMKEKEVESREMSDIEMKRRSSIVESVTVTEMDYTPTNGSHQSPSSSSLQLYNWLPDEGAVQEDLERLADQIGIRLTIIAHQFRKILANTAP